MSVGARLEAVRGEIADAARGAGRDPSGVRLIAVTKKAEPREILDAYEAGQREFGENYVQAATDRIRATSALGGIREARWHLIGALQSNKAAQAARTFEMIHSLTGARAARAIDRAMRAAGTSRSVLVQIHLGGGDQRAGLDPAGAVELAREIAGLPGLKLDGVMGVAPPGEPARPAFAVLRGVLERLQSTDEVIASRGDGSRPAEISAGMSGDLADAVAEGATLVRVGRAIFGR